METWNVFTVITSALSLAQLSGRMSLNRIIKGIIRRLIGTKFISFNTKLLDTRMAKRNGLCGGPFKDGGFDGRKSINMLNRDIQLEWNYRLMGEWAHRPLHGSHLRNSCLLKANPLSANLVLLFPCVLFVSCSYLFWVCVCNLFSSRMGIRRLIQSSVIAHWRHTYRAAAAQLGCNKTKDQHDNDWIKTQRRKHIYLSLLVLAISGNYIERYVAAAAVYCIVGAAT